MYTPGPWRWFCMNGDWHIKPDNKGYSVAAALRIAYDDDDSERSGNAKLIAAAPDLLEALQNVKLELSAMRGDWDRVFSPKVAEMVEIAIKKAT